MASLFMSGGPCDRNRVVPHHHHCRMRRKLSPKLIEHLKSPGPKRMDVWDTVLQCFGLRISPTGRKAWFVIVRLDGKQKRITIGTYPALSLAEARAEARKIIRDARFCRSGFGLCARFVDRGFLTRCWDFLFLALPEPWTPKGGGNLKCGSHSRVEDLWDCVEGALSTRLLFSPIQMSPIIKALSAVSVGMAGRYTGSYLDRSDGGRAVTILTKIGQASLVERIPEANYACGAAIARSLVRQHLASEGEIRQCIGTRRTTSP